MAICAMLGYSPFSNHSGHPQNRPFVALLPYEAVFKMSNLPSLKLSPFLEYLVFFQAFFCTEQPKDGFGVDKYYLVHDLSYIFNSVGPVRFLLRFCIGTLHSIGSDRFLLQVPIV